MAIKELKDVDCAGKIVVIRQDLNVPMKDGHISNDKRIRAALPGIKLALDKGAGGPPKGNLTPNSRWRPWPSTFRVFWASP